MLVFEYVARFPYHHVYCILTMLCQTHALEYTASLEKKGRFVLIIWPEHCLLGTPGHAVEPIVNKAIQEWASTNLKTISYVNKGMNCLTEMYSAIAAEVPLANDPSTDLNYSLLNKLNRADKVVICGQALSHCVNYTMRDILANWTKSPSQLILLTDGSSAVPSFEENAKKFVADMATAGCTVTTVENSSEAIELIEVEIFSKGILACIVLN